MRLPKPNDLLFPFLILSALPGLGGADKPAPYLLDIQTAWNAADVAVGGRLGKAWPFGPGRLEGLLDVQWRPYRKAIWDVPSPGTAIQYREDRFALGPGFGYYFPFFEALGARMATGISYSHGNYRGSLSTAESGWYPWVDGGLILGGKSLFQWGILYQWRPLPHLSPHRLALEMGFRFEP